MTSKQASFILDFGCVSKNLTFYENRGNISATHTLFPSENTIKIFSIRDLEPKRHKELMLIIILLFEENRGVQYERSYSWDSRIFSDFQILSRKAIKPETGLGTGSLNTLWQNKQP